MQLLRHDLSMLLSMRTAKSRGGGVHVYAVWWYWWSLVMTDDDDDVFRPLMSKVYPSIEVPYQLQYITHQVPTQTTSVGALGSRLYGGEGRA